MSRREINWCDEDPEVDPFVVFDVGDDITLFNRHIDYGLLLVQGAVFPSVSQAWKHGYKGKIPPGYTDFKLYGVDIYIYNPLEMPKVPDLSVPEPYKELYDEIMNRTDLDLSKPIPEMTALFDKLDAKWVNHWWARFNDIDFSFATASVDEKKLMKFALLDEYALTMDEVHYGVWCIAIQ